MSPALARLFDALAIRPEERSTLGWLFVHSLFLGVFTALYFSTANAQFLSRFGPTALPWAYLASGAVGTVAISAFSALQRRSAAVTGLRAIVGFLAALALGLWLAAVTTDGRWAAFAMFVWVFPALSLLNLEFWGLAGLLFDLRQGKRLFGLLGTGEVVSALVGFLLVPPLLEILVRPVHLLPLAATGLLACVLIVGRIAARFPEELESRPEAPGAGTGAEGGGAGGYRRYFLLLAALILLVLFAHYFVDFAFLTQVRERFGGSGAIARFIALFYGLVKVLELAMKGVFAGRLVAQFGLGFALSVLPVTLLLSAGGAVAVSHLFAGAATLFFLLVALSKLLWLVLRKSLLDPSVKVLYQPLPRDQRLAFQTRVEGLVQQGGIVLVGGVLLAFTHRGPGRVLSLLTLLLPILALWVAAAGLVYREYRSRLVAALEGRGAPPEGRSLDRPVQDALRDAPPEAVLEGLTLVHRVRPALVERLWEPLLRPGSPPAVRRATLELLGRIRSPEARDAVAALAAAPGEALRELAGRTLERMDAVEDVARSTDRLDALAGSAEAGDRRLAALAAAHGTPRVRVLSQLLWDGDPGVRRAALLAAGRTGDTSFAPRIVADLESPAYSATAAAAAAALGEPVVGELEAAFKRAGDDLGLRCRILSVYEEIGGPAAGAATLDKLDHPHASIQQRALAALTRVSLPDDPEHTARIGRWIERSADVAAWDLAALVDLADTPEASRVSESVEREVQRLRELLFELLELLCEPRAVRLVRRHLERGGPEESVYALEIADLVIPPSLKPGVLPLLEPLPPSQRLRRLDPVFPQPRMEPAERLRALAHREPSKIGVWTKACALEALASLSDGEVPDDLVAQLFSPEPLIQEVAAWSIHRIDPRAYARHSARLFRDRSRLDRLLDVDRPREAADPEEDGGPSADRLLFGRMRFLVEVPELASLAPETLVRLAAACEPRGLPPGAELPGPENPASSSYLVMDGLLEPRRGGGGDGAAALGRGSLVPRGISEPLWTPGGALVLRLGEEQLLELLGDHPALLPPFLRLLTSRITAAASSGPPAERSPAEVPGRAVGSPGGGSHA